MREKMRFPAAARHESLRQREKVTFPCENVRSHDADIFSEKKTGWDLFLCDSDTGPCQKEAWHSAGLDEKRDKVPRVLVEVS